MHANPWLIRSPSSQRRVRLYCFSYAGGSVTSYLPWQAALGPAIVLSKRLCRWQEETTEACSLHWFEGDHFFIHSRQRAVLDCVQAALADLQHA